MKTRPTAPRRLRLLAAALALSSFAGGLWLMGRHAEARSPAPAVVATITVTNLNDSGAGSLRQAIAGAVSGDTITFAPGLSGAITLTSGELGIGKDLTITGPGAKTLSVRRSSAAGTPFFRIFSVGAGRTVSISGLTVADGNMNPTSFSSEGGGIYTAGALTLTDCVVANNQAGAVGGGIAVAGTGKLEMRNCAVSGNWAGGGGGGISNDSGLTSGPSLIVTGSTVSGNFSGNTGGGIDNDGLARVTNSTVSGNTAARRGGGILNSSYIEITHSTITDNEARNDPRVTCGGGGISNSNANSHSVSIGHAIVAGNRSLSGRGPDMMTSDGLGNQTAAIYSLDYNLLGSSGGFTIAGATSRNLTHADPRLGPLADNGGPTPTHAPLADSPAIDRGNNAGAPATDQRGAARPFDGDANGVAVVDIGAIELRRHVVVNTGNAGAGSLRQALLDNEALGGGVVTFNIPAGDANCTSTRLCTITPLSSLPTLTKPVTIDGYTQPGALPNFSRPGSGAVLKIQLSGAQAGGADGLSITGQGVRVTGLVINRFNAGVRLAGATGCSVAGNFIGTDPAGKQAQPNAYGVVLTGGARANAVGGLGLNDVNVISGNSGAGVLVEQASTKNDVSGNYVGTEVSGLAPVLSAPRGGAGVRLTGGASENSVYFNTIACNGAEGVHVAGGTKNNLFANSVWQNLGLGIDLGGTNTGGDGPTPNDAGDADAGPNDLQNYPVITGASFDGVSTSIQGSLNTTPNTRAQLQFFVTIDCDHSGYGEGGKYLDSRNVQTDASGNVDFDFALSSDPDTFGKYLTATATAGGSTSEFSLCRRIASPASSLQFDAATYATTEGGAATTITVTRTNGSAGPATVNYSAAPYRFYPVVGGPACGPAGVDYVNTAGTLSWESGDTAPKTFTVPICNDHDVEGSEVIQLSLGSPSNATLGSQSTALLIVHDNDQHGIIQFEAGAAAGDERAGSISLKVLRTTSEDGPAVGVSYAFGGGTAAGGPACAPGVDYVNTAGTLSWAAGDVSAKTITLTVCDDSVFEADETVNVTLSNPTNNATLGAPATAAVTIRDDDDPGTLQFSAAGYDTPEEAGSVSISVTRAAINGAEVSVDYATLPGGTAAGGPACAPGVDYVNTAGTLSWAAGDVGGKSFAVTLCDDAAVEPGETIRVALSAPTNGGRLGTPSAAVVTIANTDLSLLVTNLGDAGAGSLRAALTAAAQNGPGTSTIGFAAGLAGDITLTAALPDLKGRTNIEGPGASVITVRRSAAEGTPEFGLLVVAPGAHAAVSGLTLTGGDTSLFVPGGGVYNQGTLTMSGCRVTANKAKGSGGGIYNADGARLTLDDCEVSNNTITNGGGGAGIASEGDGLPTRVTVNRGRIINNSSPLSSVGGGLYLARTEAALTETTIADNDMARSSGGGGIFQLAGSLALERCTISGNHANSGGGLYITNSATAALAASTVSGNRADDSGGAIFINGSTLRLSRSTVTANTARRGGGLTDSSRIAVNNSHASIIAGNSAPDIDGRINSEDYNLFGPSGFGTEIVGATAHTLTVVDPRLAPLADNGGPTLTHALLPDSPALDAGADAGAPATDQRGLPRVSDGDGDGTARSDIGAFELQAAALPTYALRGRVTRADGGAPLAQVTLSLGGDAAAATESNADGTFVFAGLRPGGYVVTPSKLNHSFAPESLTVTLGAADAAGLDFAAASTATASGAGGAVLISEFRLQGPRPASPAPGNADGERDEFIELYNNTNAELDVSGYRLDTSAGFTIELPASNVVIPARGHYLIANEGGYSLAGYGGAGAASPDHTYGGFDLPAGTGLALLDASGRVVDAVGFAGGPAPYGEGAPLPASGAATEHSYMRRLAGGWPQDTGANEADFALVSADGGPQAALGAPGPENLASPPNRTGQIATSPVAPCVALTTSPNRVRDTTPGPTATSSLGTLDIRRRFTNNTGSDVTRLRFRIVDITTAPAPTGTADLRAASSADVTIASPCGGTIELKGTTLEEPPAQPAGGGHNSTLSAGTITLGTPLASGASIDMRFLLGVQQTGAFRFFVLVEALP